MNKHENKGGVALGILLPMGLVCLFAFCSLALALMGGRAYKQIQQSVNEDFSAAATVGYLRTKLTQFNQSGRITLREEGGAQLLVIESEMNDTAYETRIYMANGRLMENFERADTPFAPVDGILIAELARCDFSLDEEGLFAAEIESEDGAVLGVRFAVAQGGGL